MLLAGDEFGRTQGGNNNAYCQDNEISWLDWDVPEAGHAQIRFVQRLTQLRHEYPILRRTRFFTGEHNEALDVKDVTWLHVEGKELTPEEWQDGNLRTFGMLMDGRAQASGIRERGRNVTLLLLLNAHHEDVAFTLPRSDTNSQWTVLLDTVADSVSNEPRGHAAGEPYALRARSLALLREKPQ